MPANYAKDLPRGYKNSIERVAIVGIGGRIGGAFTQALLKTGKHTITALVRPDSKSILPAGVKAAPINYDDESTLVKALEGQQFLVITLSVFAPPETHSKLVQAAAEAGVLYVMPNVYGSDPQNEALTKSAIYPVEDRYHEIEKLGVSSYILMSCGFWYEWSLALGQPWFGFDIRGKKVTFYDDGKTRINVSTWPQCGRALAGLLSLKELPEDETDKSPTISSWKNKPLYIDSFKVSQRDMLDSIHRLTGTTDKDWKIDFEPSDVRYENGKAELKNGIRTGFAKAMYARIFMNGDGDYESKWGLANHSLGLLKEDLDKATKRALDMVESGYAPFR